MNTTQPIIERYLPSGYDAKLTGYPQALEVLLQWLIRNRGCLYVARELFLDQPFPRSYEERIHKWYQCQSIIESATRAFEDLEQILAWYMQHWYDDPKLVRLAMAHLGILECQHKEICQMPSLLQKRPAGISSDPAPSFYQI